MGFFDWLKTAPSNVRVLDDVIWLSTQAKLDGITKAVATGSPGRDEPAAILLVAHFQDCLEDLQKIAGQAEAAGPVMALAAESLPDAASRLPFSESQKIMILVGERHPLAAHDDSILEFARGLPCQSDLVHHLSLADPLMRAFCGEWVESVLKKLGMAEDEAIESKLVVGRIKQAQREIASRSCDDSPADSAESWLRRNCPAIWQKYQR